MLFLKAGGAGGVLCSRSTARGRKFIVTLMFSGDINSNCPENDSIREEAGTCEQKCIIMGTNGY